MKILEFGDKSDIKADGTNIYYFHGTAMNEMLAKKSAKYVKKYYPSATVKCFRGKAHCENSLFNPEYMIAEIDSILLG